MTMLRTCIAGALALVVLAAPVAHADPADTYTATVSPQSVAPSSTTTYTVTFTNDAGSSHAANEATISVLGGFTNILVISATATAGGECTDPLWTASFADGKIVAIAAADSTNALCPGETLTIEFRATAPSTEKTVAWETDLSNPPEAAFTLQGSEPTVSVDGPPPAPAIGGGPPLLTNSTSATFVFSDVGPGITYLCTLDGAESACSSPASYTALSNGAHTFSVRAKDATGHYSASSAPYSWTVDTVAPETTISSAPGASASSASATFAFASNESGTTFACQLDGSAFTPCSSPRTYAGLGQGPHTFAVRAIDPAGNSDPTPASYSWRVTVAVPGAPNVPGSPDTTPPARVGRLSAAVGYRVLRLSWRLPSDPDFDHVTVLASTNARGPLGATVYSGAGTTFANKRFRNGSYYRYAVISYDHTGNRSVSARVAISPSALLRSPRDGAAVGRPPLLAWKAVPKASFYNVQLYRRGRKILTAWPKRTRLQLYRSWTYVRAQRLTKGDYRWYVWPSFGPRAKPRYGQLLGQGGFAVR
jgi:hypothetical protein